jgi:anti-sigma B factor antagonist
VTPREIRIERAEGVAVVVLVGEHDSFTADRLRRDIADLLGEGVPIVVDFAEATFVDSSTIGVLLGAREVGGRLALALPPSGADHVIRLFRTTQLDTVFAIHPSRAAAIAATRAGDGGAST